MIKKIILGCFAFVIAVLVMWNMNVNSKTTGKISDVMLANVEALAQNEGGGYGDGCDTYYDEFLGNNYLNIVLTCVGGSYSSCEEGSGLYTLPYLGVVYENFTEYVCRVF